MTQGADRDPAPYAEAVRAIEARDENLDGIPVFVALEDAGASQPAAAARRDAEAERLARLAKGYLQQQLAGREQATLQDVAMVLRVLGAHHFDGSA